MHKEIKVGIVGNYGIFQNTSTKEIKIVKNGTTVATGFANLTAAQNKAKALVNEQSKLRKK